MKNFIFLFIKSLFFITMTIVIIVAFYAYPLHSSEERCKYIADPVRIMVGKLRFNIPSEYPFHLRNSYDEPKAPSRKMHLNEFKNGKKIAHYGFCQSPNDPIFDVRNIVFNLRGLEKHLEKEYRKAYQNLGKILLNIEAYKTTSSLHYYCRKRDNAVIQNGWHRYDNNTIFLEREGKYGFKEYFSTEPLLFGLPIVFQCSDADPNPPSWAKEGFISGRTCFVRHPIAESTGVFIKFWDGHLVPEEWDEAFKEVEGFISSLLNSSERPDMASICQKIILNQGE